jgi:hypothetical protein
MYSDLAVVVLIEVSCARPFYVHNTRRTKPREPGHSAGGFSADFQLIISPAQAAPSAQIKVMPRSDHPLPSNESEENRRRGSGRILPKGRLTIDAARR